MDLALYNILRGVIMIMDENGRYGQIYVCTKFQLKNKFQKIGRTVRFDRNFAHNHIYMKRKSSANREVRLYGMYAQ